MMFRLLASIVELAAILWVVAIPATFAQPPQINVSAAPSTQSSGDAGTLTEKLQNPIADLISAPFQNNTNFNVGPHHSLTTALARAGLSAQCRS
jgi:hypothetical protein